MNKDMYAFNPMLLGPELTLNSSQNIVESVPISQYKPYLESIYGPRIPNNRLDQFAADRFFEAATAYSTDESLQDRVFELVDVKHDRSLLKEKVKRFIPYWLRLAEPVINATRMLDGAVSSHLEKYKDSTVPHVYDNNLTFMTIVFYSGSQLSSLAMDIPHFSQQHPDLLRPILNSGRALIGGQPNAELPQTTLLIPGVVRAADLKKANQLKVKTAALNERAQKAAERMITITAAIQASKELDQLLDSQDL